MIREISSFQNDWVKRVKLLQEKNRARKKEGVFIADLDRNKMLETRNKLNFLNDRDDFNLV